MGYNPFELDSEIQSQKNKLKMQKAVRNFGIFVFIYSLMRICAIFTIDMIDKTSFFTLFSASTATIVKTLISAVFFYIIPLIPFFLLFPRKLFKRNNSTYIGSEYTKSKAFSFYPAVYSLGIITSTCTILLLILIAYLGDFHFTGDDITNYFSSESTNIIAQLLITAVFVPIMEEFFFRGILLGSLRPYGDKFAIFASALFFGLMHGNILQAPFATIVGLAFGYIYVRTNSIAVTMLFHGFINGTSTLLSYYSLKSIDFILGKNFGKVSNLQGVNYVIATLLEWIVLAIIVCGIIKLVKITVKYIKAGIKKVRISYLENDYNGYSELKKLSILFSNPFVILAFCITMYYIISSSVEFISLYNLQ